MRNRILIFALLVTAAIGLLPAHAAEPDAGVFTLAAVLPADMNVAIGLKIDDASIAAIDGLIARGAKVASDLSGVAVEAPTVSGLLSNINGKTVDGVLAWAGDSIMFGSTALTGIYPPKLSLTVIALDDSAAAGAFFTGAGYTKTTGAGRFAVYTSSTATLLIGDDVLISVNDATEAEMDMLLNGDYPRLGSDEGFQKAVAALPESDYGLGGYISAETLGLDSALYGQLYGDAGFGAVMPDSASLIVDVGVTVNQPREAFAAVDPAFRRFIPAETTFFVHATALGRNIDTVFETFAQAGGTGDFRTQLTTGLASIGIDYDAFIDWSDGDYAMFGHLDLSALFDALESGSFTPGLLSDSFGFGLVIETSSPDDSTRFGRAIASLFRLAARSAGGMVATTEVQIGGAAATVVSFGDPNAPEAPYAKLALAATDDIFVIGTYNDVEALLTGAPGIADSAVMAEAERFALPDAQTLWLVDGKFIGQGAGLVGLLAYLGPQVQNTFDSINRGLIAPDQPTPTPRPPAGPEITVEQIMQIAGRIERAVRYVFASAREDADALQFRAVVVFGE